MFRTPTGRAFFLASDVMKLFHGEEQGDAGNDADEPGRD